MRALYDVLLCVELQAMVLSQEKTDMLVVP